MQRNIRRCPIRFRDADCPPNVADIFDHPQFCDRYTIVYKEVDQGWVSYRSCSDNPFHPQGIGLFEGMRVWDFGRYRDANRRKRIKWSELPEKVKRCVRDDTERQL